MLVVVVAATALLVTVKVAVVLAEALSSASVTSWCRAGKVTVPAEEAPSSTLLGFTALARFQRW